LREKRSVTWISQQRTAIRSREAAAAFASLLTPTARPCECIERCAPGQNRLGAPPAGQLWLSALASQSPKVMVSFWLWVSWSVAT